MIQLHKAIMELVPDALFSFSGDSYEDIVWEDSRPIPSKDSIIQKMKEIDLGEIAVRDKISKRLSHSIRYQEAGEYLDMLWHEIDDKGSISVNGEFYKQIKKVKDTHTKS